jgi:hypothetical protein
MSRILQGRARSPEVPMFPQFVFISLDVAQATLTWP